MPGPEEFSTFEDFSPHELRCLCQAQAGLLRDQDQRLTEQSRLIERLRAELAEATAESRRLKRQLSRNSGNSSMPPSSDDALPGRERPAKTARDKKGKKEKKRRRGRQPGAPGSALGWAEPTEVVDHHPEGDCARCGACLADATDLGAVRSWQVTDVPLVAVTVTEHRLHAAECGCGRRATAPVPQGTPDARTSYGPNLPALLVYLIVVHAVPVERACQLVRDLTGVAPSTSFAHNALTRAAKALARPTQAIRERLVASPVAHFDETGLRVGAPGDQAQVWAAVTDRYTVYHLASRTGLAFKRWGIGVELRDTVIVHDNYPVYDNPEYLSSGVRHQLCVAHLLRHLTDAAQVYPGQRWPAVIANALQKLVHAHNEARDQGLPAIPTPVAKPLTAAYDRGVKRGLKALPHPRRGKPPECRHLLELLRDRRHDVLRFCHDTRVPPTNNQAERDLRPFKTQQKISGRLTSHDVTEHRLTIRGYVSTAIKHGERAITVLRDTFLGRPWIPPPITAGT